MLARAFSRARRGIAQAISERSVHAQVMLTDEHLNFWGDFYLANPQIARAGVVFELFARAPWRYLTPDLARVSNGVQVERMRHHRHPRKADLRDVLEVAP